MQDASPTTFKTPEFPMVDIPRLEAHAAQATATFREFAEKGISQAKDNYAKMKTAAEEATSMLETTYANASKGAADYGLKILEITRSNSNAAFDFAANCSARRAWRRWSRFRPRIPASRSSRPPRRPRSSQRLPRSLQPTPPSRSRTASPAW